MGAHSQPQHKPPNSITFPTLIDSNELKVNVNVKADSTVLNLKNVHVSQRIFQHRNTKQQLYLSVCVPISLASGNSYNASNDGHFVIISSWYLSVGLFCQDEALSIIRRLLGRERPHGVICEVQDNNSRRTLSAHRCWAQTRENGRYIITFLDCSGALLLVYAQCVCVCVCVCEFICVLLILGRDNVSTHQLHPQEAWCCAVPEVSLCVITDLRLFWHTAHEQELLFLRRSQRLFPYSCTWLLAS